MTTLPPGFRFHPTDEELVAYYLKKRVRGSKIEFDVIADVDLYKCEPWDLPSKSRLGGHDLEWFFFSPRDRKYPNGSRTNRATEAGYWKATGRDRHVRTAGKTIGMKKTLVFYKGRAPHGERTDWLMHEYRLDGEEWESMNVSQDAFVLCRVFKKNGLLVKNEGSDSVEKFVVGGTEVALDLQKPAIDFDLDVKPFSIVAPAPPVTATDCVSGKELSLLPQVTADDFFVQDGGEGALTSVTNPEYALEDLSYAQLKEIETLLNYGASWPEFTTDYDLVNSLAPGGELSDCVLATSGKELHQIQAALDLSQADVKQENVWLPQVFKNLDEFILQPCAFVPVLDDDVFQMENLPPLEEQNYSSPSFEEGEGGFDDSDVSKCFIQIRPRASALSGIPKRIIDQGTAKRRMYLQRRPLLINLDSKSAETALATSQAPMDDGGLSESRVVEPETALFVRGAISRAASFRPESRGNGVTVEDQIGARSDGNNLSAAQCEDNHLNPNFPSVNQQASSPEKSDIFDNVSGSPLEISTVSSCVSAPDEFDDDLVLLSERSAVGHSQSEHGVPSYSQPEPSVGLNAQSKVTARALSTLKKLFATRSHKHPNTTGLTSKTNMRPEDVSSVAKPISRNSLLVGAVKITCACSKDGKKKIQTCVCNCFVNDHESVYVHGRINPVAYEHLSDTEKKKQHQQESDCEELLPIDTLVLDDEFLQSTTSKPKHGILLSVASACFWLFFLQGFWKIFKSIFSGGLCMISSSGH